MKHVEMPIYSFVGGNTEKIHEPRMWVLAKRNNRKPFVRRKKPGFTPNVRRVGII